MKTNQPWKILDVISLAFLALFSTTAILYRISPMTLLNPDFPTLEREDLILPDKFVLKGFSGVYDFNKETHDATFHIDDTNQVFPNEAGMGITGFSGFHNLIYFSNQSEAEKSLNHLHQEYIDYEGDFPLQITDAPLTNFLSKANRYLLWCEQYSREIIFDAEKIGTCYYWAVYDSYLSQTRLSMWPNRGGGRQYSLELFTEIITHTEDKILSKVNIQK